MSSRAAVVRAVNGLARRWGSTMAGESTVYSPVGVWPLLGVLAAGADGPARAELAAAVGLPAEAAAEGARRLLADVGRIPGVSTAVGLWTDRRVVLEPDWAAALPEHGHGELTGVEAVDRARLDEWAAKVTGGLIPAMPVELDEGTRLVLASGLSVRTRWIRPFAERAFVPSHGPWAGRTLTALTRSTALLNRAAVLRGEAGAVTELSVLGYDGVEVRLLLGEKGRAPGEVLRTGIRALTGEVERVTADVLPAAEAGPGMTVEWAFSWQPEPELRCTTVPFSVEAEHNLLQQHALFGLTAAADLSRGHFPGVSRSMPLAVGSAKQRAMAAFSAKGFEAAAVTAMGIAVGGAAWRQPPYRVRHVALSIDRPFGFLAVHRPTRLVLAAGWVNDTPDHQEPDYDFYDDDEEDDFPHRR
ncbi:serpin family protein [Kitasatospora sp. NPDC002227]|uniref:serpin family protein n=1 Tax=Kitasatospora sp. NPDC002227 TaxID=3154773 RepID=UPI0033260C51